MRKFPEDHFPFIEEYDPQFGGQLVEAVLTDAKISLDETRGFTMTLVQPGK